MAPLVTTLVLLQVLACNYNLDNCAQYGVGRIMLRCRDGKYTETRGWHAAGRINRMDYVPRTCGQTILYLNTRIYTFDSWEGTKQ